MQYIMIFSCLELKKNFGGPKYEYTALGDETMTEKKKMLLADAALLLAALSWGGGFVAGDVAIEIFSPFCIMAVRFTGAAIWMGFLFKRHIRNSTKEDWKAGLFLGLIYFVSLPLQVISLKYTTPSKHAFLLATYVVITPFISWLILHKRPQKKSFFVGTLALWGIGLISLNGSMQIGLGDMLTLAFSILYSFILVITGILSRKTNPLAMSFFQYLTIGVLSTITSLLFESIPEQLSLAGISAMIYLILINTVLAYTLQNIAQQYTSDTHAAILLSMESIFGYICGVVLYNDPFTPRVLIGGMIVFSAVLLSVVNWKDVLQIKE